MKPKTYLSLMLAAIAMLCLIGWTVYAQKETPANNSNRVVWEYKTLHGQRALREDQLNDMGLYGWELIMYDDGERGNGSFEGTYYFKRPK